MIICLSLYPSSLYVLLYFVASYVGLKMPLNQTLIDGIQADHLCT